MYPLNSTKRSRNSGGKDSPRKSKKTLSSKGSGKARDYVEDDAQDTDDLLSEAKDMDELEGSELDSVDSGLDALSADPEESVEIAEDDSKSVEIAEDDSKELAQAKREFRADESVKEAINTLNAWVAKYGSSDKDKWIP